MIFFYLWKNVFLDTHCSVISINWYVIFMQLEEITWFYSFRNFKLICKLYRRLFELRESLNVLSDINFHLNICMNIQFHRYIHLKYQFVCKLMKKIRTDLDLKDGCIKKDKIKTTHHVTKWEDLFLNDLLECFLLKSVFLGTSCNLNYCNRYVLCIQLEKIIWFHLFRKISIDM